jgi:hypothetical protein
MMYYRKLMYYRKRQVVEWYDDEIDYNSKIMYLIK